jgi:hypothetical protein
MALIECKECGNEVSSKAESCPKCGAAVETKGMGCGTGIVIVFLCGIVYAAIFPSEHPSTAPAPSTTTQPKETNDDASSRAWIAANALKNQMRNPDSFKVEHAYVPKENQKVVCLTYRSQNGFGGINREQAILTPAGRLLPSTATGFNSNWDKFCQHSKDGADEVGSVNALSSLINGSP